MGHRAAPRLPLRPGGLALAMLRNDVVRHVPLQPAKAATSPPLLPLHGAYDAALRQRWQGVHDRYGELMDWPAACKLPPAFVASDIPGLEGRLGCKLDADSAQFVLQGAVERGTHALIAAAARMQARSSAPRGLSWPPLQAAKWHWATMRLLSSVAPPGPPRPSGRGLSAMHMQCRCCQRSRPHDGLQAGGQTIPDAS
eukprot:jgi/Ulvmu1/5901/UM026_0022.1